MLDVDYLREYKVPQPAYTINIVPMNVSSCEVRCVHIQRLERPGKIQT